MSTKTNEVSISEKIDGVVLSVIGQKNLEGFQRAYLTANAMMELETLLDDEYMKPIMYLQGSALGFKTDKDLIKDGNGRYVKGPGYPVEIVRRVLTEAVLKGYQTTNNEFNIIGGNMYPAKNGLERKANEWPGLKYSIIQTIKAFDTAQKSALVNSQIKWSIGGESFEENVPIPLKIDAYTSVDAVLGKAKRKSLAWLLSNVSGEIVVDGDVDDVTFEQLNSNSVTVKEEKKLEIEKPEFTKKHFKSAMEAGATIDTIREGYSTTPEIEAAYESFVLNNGAAE